MRPSKVLFLNSAAREKIFQRKLARESHKTADPCSKVIDVCHLKHDKNSLRFYNLVFNITLMFDFIFLSFKARCNINACV